MTTTADPLIAINPLPDETAARLAIDAAEHEMLEALLASPEAVVPGPPPRRAPARRRPLLAVLGAAAVAIPVLAVLAVLPMGRHARTQPTPPAGHGTTTRPSPRPAPRMPATTPAPLVLFQQPGWHAWYGDEESPTMGELDFARNGAPIRNGAPAGGDLELHWYPAAEAPGYIKDRADGASIKTTMRVLGATAHVIQYAGTVGAQHMYSAIWTRGPRMLEFRGNAANMAGFKAQLARLGVVDSAVWLKALPKTVVPSTERSAVIRTMLRGIPLPPGFDPSQIPGKALSRDHYQLATAVTGVAACEWFARWGRARTAGNRAEVNQAVSAMATAKHWPILRQINSQGGWTSVLVGYAQAMPSGRWFNRPLLGDVDSGLGCSSEWKIKLPGAKAPGGLQPVKPGA